VYLVLTKIVILMKILASVEDVDIAIASTILPSISATLPQVVCVGKTLCPWKSLD